LLRLGALAQHFEGRQKMVVKSGLNLKTIRRPLRAVGLPSCSIRRTFLLDARKRLAAEQVLVPLAI
jgi:hypothetical protein